MAVASCVSEGVVLAVCVCVVGVGVGGKRVVVGLPVCGWRVGSGVGRRVGLGCGQVGLVGLGVRVG